MLQYYTVIVAISSMALIAMSLLVHENSRFERQTKQKFYLTYLVVEAAMLAEWAGLILNHAPANLILLHKIVKCMDYVLTPLAGVCVAALVSGIDWVRLGMEGLVVFNIVFQGCSTMKGWTFYIDQDNVYYHGPCYLIYIVIYLLIIIGVLIQFYSYGKKYKKQNVGSLAAIIFMVLAGVIIQEVLDVKVTYLTIIICVILMYIHYSEFSQMISDDNLLYQKQMLETDALTRLYSRHAYTRDLKELENKTQLPAKLVVFSVDINELKTINDTLGHLAGDELITGASGCIWNVLSHFGKCYRTGGDEFISFLYVDPEQTLAIEDRLIEAAQRWHGSLVKQLTLSIGYAAAKDYPKLKIEELIHIADEKMYESKAHFYTQSGKNRRREGGRRLEIIEEKQQEYIDIINALANDITGLYIIDRERGEVTAYRVSASDHRIRSGVPLQHGYEAAMNQFVEKIVHPDDQEMMRQSVRAEFIEKGLELKSSFTVHFRTLIDGEIRMNSMRCMRNTGDGDYEKIIIAFSTEPVRETEELTATTSSVAEQMMHTGSFIAWYQPKYNPYTGNVVGAEALLRWKTKDGHLLRPGQFLRAFEEDGMISWLDEHIFRAVCSFQQKRQEQGLPMLPISVNLSRSSMQALDIAERYKTIADECGISPKLVPIEITESAAVSTRAIKPVADAFYEAGFPLHMDDFGSGKSALTELNMLHFDVVKLDKSLIDYIGEGHGNLVLLYTIALSKELGLHLVAEGVEKQEQLEFLKENGCDTVQGFYFSKPLPEDAFEQEIAGRIETPETAYEYSSKHTVSESVQKRALDSMIRRMPGGFFTYRNDASEQILTSNQYLWNLFGCETEAEFMEFVGGSFQGMVCAEDLEETEKRIAWQIENGDGNLDHVEYHIRRKDGQMIFVTDYGYLDEQAEGGVFYVFISEAEK